MGKAVQKKEVLEHVAEENDIAVVVLDSGGSEVSVSGNNSMCARLYFSDKFGPKCAEFCGKALEKSVEAGRTIEYQCYAGLNCRAVPVRDAERQLVAIVGRTFSSAENYRKATERVISGDWKEFEPGEFFSNVLLSASDSKLERAARRLEELTAAEKEMILQLSETAKDLPVEKKVKAASTLVDTVVRRSSRRTRNEDVMAWRLLFGSLLKLDYKNACDSILKFMSNRFDLPSLAWLERRGEQLVPVTALGELENLPIKIGAKADDRRLMDAAAHGRALELSERKQSDRPYASRSLHLFPVIVGKDTRSALAISGRTIDDEDKRLIARFCQSIAPQLEILRLRTDIERRNAVSRAVEKFNEGLKDIDTADFWMQLTQVSAELLQAERASLLIRNERSTGLRALATVGVRADLSEDRNVGRRIAQDTLDRGKPVLVKDVKNMALDPVMTDRRYKTPSFISYPIFVGKRGLAVLNFADKVGGEAFDDRDLEVLRAIVPQIAVSIDRATLKEQAGTYAQLSVTDSLTGLLNRRYMEARLTEELRRSSRHGSPMSFMMLDVDEFKAYNDKFGHPSGDEALKLVGQLIRDTVRGADVPARYGGEEFAVLLPQTTGEEAQVIAERIRQRIQDTEFPNRRVTISIGIASFSSEINTMRALISAADKALYEAKRMGRNNVKSFGNLGSDAGNVH